MSSTGDNDHTNTQDDEEQEGNDSPSTNTSSGHHGMSQTRRQTILLQVLFHHVITTTRRREQGTNQIVATQPSSGPLRTLTTSDAESCGATCRFCFEGPRNDNTNDALVSPCNCSGGSEWVHLSCLRRWQHQTNNSAVCNVCLSPYQTPPPPRLRRNLIASGTLLVSCDSHESNSTFHQTVIVMFLNHESPYGLIVNTPMTEQSSDGLNLANVSLRRGGPVCGGRFGVSKYIVAHALPQFEIANFSSIPVFDESQQQRRLQILVSSTGQRAPALLGRQELSEVVQALVGDQSTQQQQQHGVILFLGYCRWRRGQLEREIQRGSWRVCNNGTDRDVFNNGNLWEELMQSERLLPPMQLLEEETEESTS